jgi:hypothetical protein
MALDGVDISVTRRVGGLAGESIETPAAALPSAESQGWRQVVEQLNVMEIPKLRIDALEVSNGRAAFVDETNDEVYTKEIDPLNFSLFNLSTVSEEAMAMKLVAETKAGAALSWEGSLKSQPLRSEGSFKMEGLEIHALSPYYAQLIRFNVERAVFGLEFDYLLDFSNIEDLFALTDGHISLTEVVCEPIEAGDRILAIDEVAFEGIRFHFPQMALKIDRVALSKGTTLVRRDADGAINLLGLLAERESEAGDEAEAEVAATLPAGESELPAFSYEVELLEVTDYAVVWEEALSQGLAQVAVGIPTLQLTGLSSDVEKPFTIDATYTFGEAGSLELDGTIISSGGELDLGIKLQNFRLDKATAYTKEFANLNVESGSLDFNGRVLNDAEQGLRVNGTASIADFSAAEVASGTMRYAWETLEVAELAFAAAPFALEIQSVRLVEPALSMRRQTAEVVDAPNGDVVVEVEGESVSGSSAAANIVINLIQVEAGSFVLEDATVEPVAALQMSEIAIDLKNLNLAAAEVATLRLGGVFNESLLELNGQFDPSAWKRSTALQVKLSKLGLAQFSSYSGQALGRRIDKGIFSLESDWSITDSQLKASNKIVVDQLNFGDSVKSAGAVSLPLDLAVTLLAGPGGVMDLSLPLSGDLSDPKVGIGQIVRTALVGIVSSAASAPFKLLSGLVDSEADLSVVEFAGGESKLSSETVDRLNTLAEALKERPTLNLEMVAQITDADRRALKRAQLRTEIMGGPAKEGDATYRTLLIKRYRESADALGGDDTEVAAESAADISKLEDVLIKEIVVAEVSLLALASERVSQVQQHMTTSHNLDASRMSAAEYESAAEGAGLRFELK